MGIIKGCGVKACVVGQVVGLQAALEQERAARLAASAETAAAEAASRAAQAEREARARDLHAARAALHDTSEKLAAAAAERDMHYVRVSAPARRHTCTHTYSDPNRYRYR